MAISSTRILGQLKLSHTAGCGSDPAVIAAGDRGIRQTPHRVIQEVEGFHPELQRLAFSRYAEVFVGREVPREAARSDYGVPTRIAKLVDGLERECGGVERGFTLVQAHDALIVRPEPERAGAIFEVPAKSKARRRRGQANLFRTPIRKTRDLAGTRGEPECATAVAVNRRNIVVGEPVARVQIVTTGALIRTRPSDVPT
jgi:hypothetical protein